MKRHLKERKILDCIKCDKEFNTINDFEKHESIHTVKGSKSVCTSDNLLNQVFELNTIKSNQASDNQFQSI